LNDLPNLLLEQIVDLRDLQFIGNQLNHITFPSNTILFEFADGFYVKPDLSISICVNNQPNQSSFEILPQPTNVKQFRSFSLEELIQIISGNDKLNKIQEETKKLANEIDAKLLKKRIHLKKIQTIEIIRLKILELQKEYETQFKLLQEEKDKVEAKRVSLLPRIKEICASEVSLLGSKRLLTEDIKKLCKNKKTFKSHKWVCY